MYVCVFRYWVLFLVCTVGVALMLTEVKVIIPGYTSKVYLQATKPGDF